MSGKSLTLSCPNCGEAIEVSIRKVPKQPTSIEDVKDALEEWNNQVDITEAEGSIVVTPKEFLGKKSWYQINNTLQEFNVEWVSAGKESRWIIRA